MAVRFLLHHSDKGIGAVGWTRMIPTNTKSHRPSERVRRVVSRDIIPERRRRFVDNWMRGCALFNMQLIFEADSPSGIWTT